MGGPRRLARVVTAIRLAHFLRLLSFRIACREAQAGGCGTAENVRGGFSIWRKCRASLLTISSSLHP